MGFDLGMDLGMGFHFGFKFCGFCVDFALIFLWVSCMVVVVVNPLNSHFLCLPESPPSRTPKTPTHKPLIAASTFSGSLHLFANAVEALLEFECSVLVKELHVGVVSCVDVKDGGAECVTVEGLRSVVVYLQSLID